MDLLHYVTYNALFTLIICNVMTKNKKNAKGFVFSKVFS